MTNNRYTEIHYNEALRPYTEYPNIFCNHICDNYFKTREGKLLDLCCGRGEHMEIFQNIGFNVYGIDIETIAKEKGLNVSILNVENEKFPYEDNFFDVIIMKSAIEHIRNIDHLMTEIYRVLKRQGTLLITTCDWKNNYKIFYDDYTHKTPFTKASMEDMLRIYKFNDICVNYFYHLPFTWKSELLKIVAKIISFIPLKYTQTTELNSITKIIRFSKEVQLLGCAKK